MDTAGEQSCIECDAIASDCDPIIKQSFGQHVYWLSCEECPGKIVGSCEDGALPPIPTWCPRRKR